MSIIVPPNLNIALIVATDTDRAIAKGNRIPWRHIDDMRYFRDTTIGHMVLMGRKTWESLPFDSIQVSGSPYLPMRHNLIMSSSLDERFFVENPPLYPTKGMTSIQLVTNVQEAIDRADNTRSLIKMHDGRDLKLFVIGGQSVYEQFLPHANTVHHNVIQTRIRGADRYFPEMAAADWRLTESHDHPEKGEQLPWKQRVYVRR